MDTKLRSAPTRAAPQRRPHQPDHVAPRPSDPAACCLCDPRASPDGACVACCDWARRAICLCPTQLGHAARPSLRCPSSPRPAAPSPPAQSRHPVAGVGLCACCARAMLRWPRAQSPVRALPPVGRSRRPRGLTRWPKSRSGRSGLGRLWTATRLPALTLAARVEDERR